MCECASRAERAPPQGEREQKIGKCHARTLDICWCVLGGFAAHRRSRCCMPPEISVRWHKPFFAEIRRRRLPLTNSLGLVACYLHGAILSDHYYEGAQTSVWGVGFEKIVYRLLKYKDGSLRMVLLASTALCGHSRVPSEYSGGPQWITNRNAERLGWK